LEPAVDASGAGDQYHAGRGSSRQCYVNLYIGKKEERREEGREG
jgi:hypothetical protein